MKQTHRVLILTAALTMLLLSEQPHAAAKKPAQIGDKVGALTFKDIRYLPRSLDDFRDKQAFVLVFTNTTCPLVQRYLPTLQKLHEAYRDKGVQFLAVNVGAEDSIVTMAAQAVRHEIAFPFVKDVDGRCVEALGVQRTPEVVVIDGQRTLCYRGRIDDQYRLGGTRPNPTRHDLQEALDDVLSGRDVRIKETPVDGCLITRPEEVPPSKAVTFTDHVAPLMQKHCQECHQPGTAAPFALITYVQVASKAKSIAEVVAEQRMPPWYASPEHGEFVNRRGLSAQERETILQWVRGGKAVGDEAKLPMPPAEPKDNNKWLIGEPDLVLSVPEHTLPASGDIPYKYVILPHQFKEDTWIQKLQIRPSNPRVVHHCNLVYFNASEGFKKSNFITGTVPGGEPLNLDAGVAFCIPKGTVIGAQIHYVSTGKEEKCQINVGIRYAREVVRKQLRHYLMVDHKFQIPPVAPADRVAASKVLDRDALGIGLFVHMHLRGRDMTFQADYPDKKSETLLVVPNYTFDWQMPYKWAPGTKRFPKGTRMTAVAHYDNSAFNPFNPDPSAMVKDGLQTRDEMMNGFFFFVDEAENLGLTIDPKTGFVVGEANGQR